MYDSISADNIPLGVEMVAGYIDAGPHPAAPPWSDADWARFPNAVKVRIATQASTNDGHVIDVEQGDATPFDAPKWVARRRQQGLAQPTVYCSLSLWDTCKSQFDSQGIGYPEWWIAAYNNQATLYPGSVAHQYTDTGPYDLSAVADYWPSVDDNPSPTPTKGHDKKMWLAFIADKNWCDVYYAGVLVDGFTNSNPNPYGVGPQMQRYIDQGVPWTFFASENAYSGSRARLAKAYSGS